MTTQFWAVKPTYCITEDLHRQSFIVTGVALRSEWAAKQPVNFLKNCFNEFKNIFDLKLLEDNSRY